jgi:hypothetical protein
MGDSETAESDTSSPRPHGRRGALQPVSSGGKFAASSRESSRRSSSSSFFRKISNSEVKYHAADEKPKIVRDYIVGKLLGEGAKTSDENGAQSSSFTFLLWPRFAVYEIRDLPLFSRISSPRWSHILRLRS